MKNSIKILTVVGARPQFIKASVISREIRARQLAGSGVNEVILHTGQHYDENMSKVFFEELEIPEPDYNLGVGPGSHADQTGRMMKGIEKILIKEKPDLFLTYGDTNSTLAGSLAAGKLNIPMAHVEAGLRSFNMRMPEEINRIVTDRISDLLFCPTETAVENLTKEGITQGVYLSGDVMYDCALFFGKKAGERSRILDSLKINEKGYALATIHRSENTDNIENLGGIISALEEISGSLPVILPLHPRTRGIISNTWPGAIDKGIKYIEPVSYLDMARLEQAASIILTDSGGVQKEALFYGVPCITLRNETEWVETLDGKWNVLAGTEKSNILKRFSEMLDSDPFAVKPANFYGDGEAGKLILDVITAKSSPLNK